MERYKITYLDINISQIKTFIDQSEYEEVKIKKQEVISLLAEENKKPQKNKKLIEELEERYDSVSKELSRKYGQFFTNKSPLGLALLNNSNLTLPSNQGGSYRIKFQKI